MQPVANRINPRLRHDPVRSLCLRDNVRSSFELLKQAESASLHATLLPNVHDVNIYVWRVVFCLSRTVQKIMRQQLKSLNLHSVGNLSGGNGSNLCHLN